MKREKRRLYYMGIENESIKTRKVLRLERKGERKGNRNRNRNRKWKTNIRQQRRRGREIYRRYIERRVSRSSWYVKLYSKRELRDVRLLKCTSKQDPASVWANLSDKLLIKYTVRGQQHANMHKSTRRNKWFKRRKPNNQYFCVRSLLCISKGLPTRNMPFINGSSQKFTTI